MHQNSNIPASSDENYENLKITDFTKCNQLKIRITQSWTIIIMASMLSLTLLINNDSVSLPQQIFHGTNFLLSQKSLLNVTV